MPIPIPPSETTDSWEPGLPWPVGGLPGPSRGGPLGSPLAEAREQAAWPCCTLFPDRGSRPPCQTAGRTPGAKSASEMSTETKKRAPCLRLPQSHGQGQACRSGAWGRQVDHLGQRPGQWMLPACRTPPSSRLAVPAPPPIQVSVGRGHRGGSPAHPRVALCGGGGSPHPELQEWMALIGLHQQDNDSPSQSDFLRDEK